MSDDAARFVRRHSDGLLRTAVAASSGVLLWAGYPPRDLWFLAPLALAGLAGVFASGRVGHRAGLGYAFAFAAGFFVPLLPWLGSYVGAWAWLGLAAVLALYTALLGPALVVTSRLRGGPLWFALAWVSIEWARSSFPLGGFGWGRIVFGQTSGPFLPLASIAGAPAVTFAVALCGAGLARIALTVARPGPGRSRLPIVVGLAAVLAPPLAGLSAAPSVASRADAAPSITVAAVQGSVPRLGLDFNAQRRAVLDNHIAETRRLAARVAAGQVPRPDLVLWPENASDIDPFADPSAGAAISAAARAVDAPIVLGAVTRNPDGRPANATVVWTPAGPTGSRHDKRILQPFGEYLPAGFETVARWLVPNDVDRIGGFVPGRGDGTVTVSLRDGRTVSVGIATCYEVLFDEAFRLSVSSGANILAVPTNNATYITPTDSDMTFQQLAMSRVRAVEHGRAVVVAATSGVSGVVEPDGRLVAQAPLFDPATLVVRLPMFSGETLADALGPWPERGAVAVYLAGIVMALLGGGAVCGSARLADRFGRRRDPVRPSTGSHDERNDSSATHR